MLHLPTTIRKKPARALAQIILLAAAFSPLARADEPTTTTATTESTPDKWQYSLLNPTPTADLRGMDTDRPNVTNTPHTIDAGHLQIETGLIDYTYDRSRSAGTTYRTDDFSFAASNFRLGILNNLELNAVIIPYELDRTHDNANNTSAYSRGFGDTIIGAKLNLWGNEGGDTVWASGLAIQPQFKFPTASDGGGNGHFEFSTALPFLINLPAGFHLGLQAGVSLERSSENDGNVAGMQNSFSIDRPLLGNLDVYLEYASDVTTEKHAQAVQTIDIGGTYPINDNISLDAGVALGLNNATSDVQVLAGVSVRF
jgi:hypothetical protein